jgi:hypothetical protein
MFPPFQRRIATDDLGRRVARGMEQGFISLQIGERELR